MTILAEHITEGGLTQMAYQQEPNQIIYATRNDGELVALTYQRDQQVTAWHRHIFGGRFGNATITVTDFANSADGTRIVLTKADGNIQFLHPLHLLQEVSITSGATKRQT